MAVTGHAGPRALVLRALGLGDMLTALPALRALRCGLPGHRITLAAPEPLAPLARLTGAVDDVLPTRGLTPLAPTGPIDVAVNLHGRGPQSHRLLGALRPSDLMAFTHLDLPAVAGPVWRADEHEVGRWCRMVAWYGLRPDRDDLDLPTPALDSPAPNAVVIHPGAGYQARRWPAERYAEVAVSLRAAGLDIVVTGGPAETDLARHVVTRAGLPPDADLSGRTNVLELAALVARARMVVCGDTGVGHLATACRTPSVLLFGPTSPMWWGPPPLRAEHIVLWTGGDIGDPNATRPDHGLLAIKPRQVVAAALRNLTSRIGRV
jgi:ADP-heptose:LPS heptosyltransferase